MILSSVYFVKAARIEDVDLRDLGPSDHLPGLDLMPKKSDKRLLLPNVPYHWSWDKELSWLVTRYQEQSRLSFQAYLVVGLRQRMIKY